MYLCDLVGLLFQQTLSFPHGRYPPPGQGGREPSSMKMGEAAGGGGGGGGGGGYGYGHAPPSNMFQVGLRARSIST